MPIIIVVSVGLGIGLLSIFLIRRKVKTLPDLDDDVFLKKFIAIHGDVSCEAVLRERDVLAMQIGIPCHKLDPAYTFDELSNYLECLGSYSLAIGDLESTLSEQFEKLGVKKPYKRPSTIGELIHDIIKAKAAGSSDSSLK